jgi:cation diffusion facilitator CzcD-associated flavoprotein CzcO/acetyl esterase/lipase
VVSDPLRSDAHGGTAEREPNPLIVPDRPVERDAVVVGAGFAGLYLLHRLRRLGWRAVALESADDVGGTWYWNRYPGARCDIMTVDYSYSWDPDLQSEWQWSEKYATQPEILRYLQHVADKHDLRRDIRFSTRLERAAWRDETRSWAVHTSDGDEISCRFLVMASGCLSVPKPADVPGVERFQRAVYYTSRWPHDGVDFTGRRVAVIGTGSSGIQSIPIIAKQAAALTVFQRTPNFSRPAKNGPIPTAKLDAFRRDPAAYRESARWTRVGVTVPPIEKVTFQATEAERHTVYEALWESGDLIPPLFPDVLLNETANEMLCEFLRGKIRSIVTDPVTAEALCPKDHYYATKRPCLDSGYYETFNLPHVRLVDLRTTPIVSITEEGIETTAETLPFDAIVFATGFDAMTGAVVSVEVRGRNGLSLAGKWAEGPRNYLGLMSQGFPNFFTITGPGSPSVLSNMVVSIEQHVDWVIGCLDEMREQGLVMVEPTAAAEAGWVQHVNDFGDLTLYPKARSWYTGANVPGKPRVFLPYVGGVDTYRRVCDEVVRREYLGLSFDGPGGSRCNDGVVCRLKPDVQLMLTIIGRMGLPSYETLDVPAARAQARAVMATRPPGPEVGAIEDGVFPGPAGPLAYRLFRPATPGPHPIVAYFHGGGWVLGGADADAPFCRDLCLSSEAIVVSLDYRHAPEARFPAAVEDAWAAVQWVTAHAESLGGAPGRLAVCGWSAGANLAAVACQLARDAGAPRIEGQLLVAPVIDADFSRRSCADNGEGYGLTAALLRWFWDHYADEPDRTDPRASPLHAVDLRGLPPALIVTCEFDPLRDGGAAYAEALSVAGGDVRHLDCAGQIHSSLLAVGAIPSGAAARQEMASALRGFFHATGVQST